MRDKIKVQQACFIRENLAAASLQEHFGIVKRIQVRCKRIQVRCKRIQTRYKRYNREMGRLLHALVEIICLTKIVTVKIQEHRKRDACAT